jgi:glutaredoxin
MTVTLYTRAGCHLCAQAEPVVRRVAAEHGAEVEVVDIDTEPALVERYTVRVPVVAVGGVEVAEYEVSEAALRAALRPPSGLLVPSAGPTVAADAATPRPSSFSSRAWNQKREEASSSAWVGWAGVALHLAVGVFPYASTGLLAPPAGVALVAVVWLVLLVVVLRLARPRPLRALLVAPGALAAWAAILTAGDLLLGWTA